MSKLNAISKSQQGKTLLYVFMDIILINFSIILGITLWYGGTIPGLPGGKSVVINPEAWLWYSYAVIWVTPICVIVYGIFKFYSNIWKYASIDDVYKIVIADTIIFVSLYYIDRFFISKNVDFMLPRRMLLVAWIIDVVLFVFSRSGYRLIKKFFINLGNIISKKTGTKRVLVVGAGDAGYNVVKSIANGGKGYENKTAIIVVDDDFRKNNSNIMGVRVTYNCDSIPRLAKEYEIDEIIIAIPSANSVQTNRIIKKCTETNCALKMIPAISDISDGEYNSLRDLNITDLLFRDEVQIDVESIAKYITDKTVLVTGGGGSIGSELCRQIAKFNPKLLVIFDIYENNAYELFSELKNKYGEKLNAIVRVGTIRDINCVENVFKEYKPQVVFHAAAHKHVPLMEIVPAEAVKNNVFGTYNVAKCADKYGCDRFVLLSTDKAVNPTNVMGATKRITELIIQEFASKSKTKFVAVRFGNVLGSNGSVIPLFQRQIKEGGPVTVTHKDITRFFMTIPEASRLVLQAAALGESGRIFVLNMGEQVKIDELARNLIKLSGYIPDNDIQIVYTGLRAGEKLYEELIMDEEKDQMQLVYHDKIFVTKPIDMDYENFENNLQKLKNSCEKDAHAVKLEIKKIVPNYNGKDL